MYELTIYFGVGNTCYSIVSKLFARWVDMLMYCTDFDGDNILFDVWDESAKVQYNINQDVEDFKETMKAF